VLRLFKPGSGDDRAAPRGRPEVVEVAGTARVLVCSACGRRITTPDARIEVGGRHEHECVNPHGYRWRIGCFAAAEGVDLASEPESYWSWFPGFTWQIENCAACRQLMGWLYRSGDQQFHGLVLEHLREVTA
jgi:hypothetical protein